MKWWSSAIVLQLHRTPWLRDDWSKDDIKIYDDDTYGLNENVLVSSSFPEAASQEISGRDAKISTIQNEILFALGIVLLSTTSQSPGDGTFQVETKQAWPTYHPRESRCRDGDQSVMNRGGKVLQDDRYGHGCSRKVIRVRILCIATSEVGISEQEMCVEFVKVEPGPRCGNVSGWGLPLARWYNVGDLSRRLINEGLRPRNLREWGIAYSPLEASMLKNA